jgi:SH3-like domain-containing protein
MPLPHTLNALTLATALAVSGATGALAATGDLHRVTSERANLRAGPSEANNVRGQIERGEQVVELRETNGWIGVRVVRTGEEGWVSGSLLERVSQSTLGQGQAETSAGFLDLSESFDRALRGINTMTGHPAVREVRQAEGGALRVTPNDDWLRATSRDAHLMTALAAYQMWKNHQNNAPVRVVLLDGREPYITIADEGDGPRVTVAGPQQG